MGNFSEPERGEVGLEQSMEGLLVEWTPYMFFGLNLYIMQAGLETDVWIEGAGIRPVTCCVGLVCVVFVHSPIWGLLNGMARMHPKRIPKLSKGPWACSERTG